MGGHQTSHTSTGINGDTTYARSHQAVFLEDPLFDSFPDKMGEIRCEQQVVAPECFGMIAPGDQGPKCFSILLVEELQHAKTRIEYFGFSGIDHQVGGSRQILGDGETNRTNAFCGIVDGLGGLVLHVFHVSRIDAARDRIWTPKTQQVGTLVGMGGTDDGIGDSGFLRNPVSHIDHIVVHEADGIEDDDGQPGFSVVDDHGPCPEVVVDAIGCPVLSETCNPDRIKLAVAISVGEGLAFFGFVFGILVFIIPAIGYGGGNGHG